MCPPPVLLKGNVACHVEYLVLYRHVYIYRTDDVECMCPVDPDT